MNTKHIILVSWLVATNWANAQKLTTEELVRPIVDASEVSFQDFVKITTQVPLPPLLLPKATSSHEPMILVSSLIWKRLSELHWAVSQADKTESLERMQAMCLLRDWLLEHDAYTNLFLASYIEENMSISILAALSDNLITAKEARQMVNRMAKSVTINAILTLAEKSVPNSVVLREIKTSNVETLTIPRVIKFCEKRKLEKWRNWLSSGGCDL